MRTYYLLCIALLCAAQALAEPEAEAKPEPEADPVARTKTVAARIYKPVHAPVATSEDKVYLLFGRGAPNTPVSLESVQDGLVDADNLQLQSFHPIYDEDLGTVLIPSGALKKFNEEEEASDLEEIEDPEDLGRQSGRRRGNRRRLRRRRRRQRRRRQQLRRRRRNRRRRQRRRQKMRRRRHRRRRGRGRNRQRS